MRNSSNLLVLFFALVGISACQTSPKTKVERLDLVKVGMDKAQVLETTGFGPRHSDRKSGQDRWIFEVFPEKRESVVVNREVRFQNGKVIYVGDVKKPEISAEEQDRLNATAKSDNVAIEDTLRREGRKNSVDLKEELSSSMPQPQKFEVIVPMDETSAPASNGTSQ